MGLNTLLLTLISPVLIFFLIWLLSRTLVAGILFPLGRPCWGPSAPGNSLLPRLLSASSRLFPPPSFWVQLGSAVTPRRQGFPESVLCPGLWSHDAVLLPLCWNVDGPSRLPEHLRRLFQQNVLGHLRLRLPLFVPSPGLSHGPLPVSCAIIVPDGNQAQTRAPLPLGPVYQIPNPMTSLYSKSFEPAGAARARSPECNPTALPCLTPSGGAD